MKVIIAGSRDITCYHQVIFAFMESGFYENCTEIVSGCARGVDSLGEQIASSRGIPVKKFPADWERYGKRAGPLRNIEMGDYADALVAVRLNGSKGTSHMIKYMKSLGKPVYVMDINDNRS